LTQMSMAALAVFVLPVVLAVQGKSVSLCVSPCALFVEPLGLVGKIPSVAYEPDSTARHIYVDDASSLLFVGSVVVLYVDYTEPLARMVLDTQVVVIVLGVLLVVLAVLEMYRGASVVQGKEAQPADLNTVVKVALIVVVPLIVASHMVRVDVYCHELHCVCHRDCVLGDLIGLVALYMLELSPVHPLIVWFVHPIQHQKAYREESDDCRPPNRHIPCAAVLRRPPSLGGSKHQLPVEAYNGQHRRDVSTVPGVIESLRSFDDAVLKFVHFDYKPYYTSYLRHSSHSSAQWKDTLWIHYNDVHRA
jgi:hypothetical protein